VIKSSYKIYCAFLLALFSTSCAAVEPNPYKLTLQPSPMLSQSNAPVENASSIEGEENWPERAREVLVNALSLTGVRYKYGGNSPETGFDCSGFVRYVYQQATSLSLPHNALAISRLGQKVEKDELKPGDLVFFNTLKSAFSHVGIYLGNNRFIHSPSSGGKVKIESMQEGYWAKRYNGAQRIEQAER
jgi:cell wall-associated NlpC family hydrolase